MNSKYISMNLSNVSKSLLITLEETSEITLHMTLMEQTDIL
jgi:hypothetical protein